MSHHEPTPQYAASEGASPGLALEVELGALIVRELNLEVDPTAIDPTEPLYGGGLGLDSIDILEIALLVSKTYGVELKADQADNHLIFASLRNLCDYVARHRAK